MPNAENDTGVPCDEIASGLLEKPAGDNSLQASKDTPPDCPRRKRQRRKRVSLGEAMRACGLDEHAIAGMYKRVLRSLHESEPKLGAKVQFLKECARLLDAKHTGRGSRNRNEFRAVKLIHKVPRPVRDGNGPKAES
jgi:hypothetical protein